MNSTMPKQSLTTEQKDILHYIIKDLHFKVGSFEKIQLKENDKGELKKTFKGLGKGWTENEPVIKEGDTAFYTLTGQKSNLIVIDVDKPDNPDLETLQDLCFEYSNFIVRTKKGTHYYFKYTNLIKNSGDSIIGLDTKSDGGMILSPPTVYKHEDNTYEYEISRKPIDDDEFELREVPKEIIEELKKISKKYVLCPEDEKKPKPKPKEEQKDEEKDDEKIEKCSLDNKVSVERDIIIKVLDSLNIKRYTDNNSWFLFGAVCYNEKGLLNFDDFVKYSSKAPNFVNEKDCERVWKQYKQNYKNAKARKATLWNWLKEDNITVFKELIAKSDDMWYFIKLMNDNDASTYFYNKYPNKYLYNSKLGWYNIQPNNTWKSAGQKRPSSLNRMICECFQNLIKDFRFSEIERYSNLMKNTDNRDEETKIMKEHADRLKILDRQYIHCGGNQFSKNVGDLLPSLYEVDKLEDLIDMDRDLIAFEDSVYVLSTGVVRNIEPKDYISTTTGYNYPKSLNPEVRETIKTIIRDMFETDEEMNFVLLSIASTLLNYNKFERFYVWTGRGGNGKGLITALVKRALGGHYISVSNSLFTKKGGNNKDAPLNEVVDARSKKMVMTTEPEGSDYLQVAVIKQFTGGDDINARKCHEKEVITYKPLFTLYLQCNNIPKLNSIDDGIKRRILIIKFPFQFRGMPNKDNPYEKQANSQYKKDFEENTEYRDEFMRMLLEKVAELYKMTDNEFITKIPKCVKNETDNFMDESNLIKDWLKDNTEISYTDKKGIGVREAYNNYETYTRQNEQRPITSKHFKELMKYNNFIQKTTGDGERYMGLVFKNIEIIEEEEKKDELD